MSDNVVASGKRKSAIARAVIKKGDGHVRVNKIPLEVMTPELARLKIMEPLSLVEDKASQVDIHVNVEGGGIMGQAEASRTAIAKGLVEFFKEDDLERRFKQYDRALLISDPRRKLPKKPMGRGARKKRQKSYR
ncbi:MAG: 30S ribosomal protein S9 [Methanomassiliicoccales archaeon]